MIPTVGDVVTFRVSKDSTPLHGTIVEEMPDVELCYVVRFFAADIKEERLNIGNKDITRIFRLRQMGHGSAVLSQCWNVASIKLVSHVGIEGEPRYEIVFPADKICNFTRKEMMQLAEIITDAL